MAEAEQEIVLRLSRRFDAPRAEVFDAWTNPAVLRSWWSARDGWEGWVAEVELRPGGQYQLSMRDSESGELYTVFGEYTEVRPPERLAYTWTWEGEPEIMRGSERSLVVVDFLEAGEETEVVLTHRGFADPQIRDLHGEGWRGCLDSLSGRVFDESR